MNPENRLTFNGKLFNYGMPKPISLYAGIFIGLSVSEIFNLFARKY